MRFRCTPALGEPHTFSVLITAADVERTARWSKPPACPRLEHKDSAVTRNGTYGKHTPRPRQMYRCVPQDGSKPHKFTPPLPRDHVHENGESCDHCDELRGVHRGETAAARRHAWSTRVVVRGLEQLAAGASYADVGRWAVRVTGTTRTRRSKEQIARASAQAAGEEFDVEQWRAAATPAPAAGTTEPPKRRKVSQASRTSRAAWHIAADWVEAFSPTLFGPIESQLRKAALTERGRLNVLTASGQPLDRPQVVLVDDVPVYGQDLDRKGTRTRRDAGYFVLVLAELHWPAPSEDDDPMLRPPQPTVKLRLVRAMAKSNTPAWRLLFNELGYTPDYIVADAGSGIAAAIRAHYAGKGATFIPSLWHLAQRVEAALADTSGAMTVTASGRELIPPLRDHLRKLNRQSGVLDSKVTWGVWWDDLLDLLVSYGLAADEVRTKRRMYEPAMLDALPDLARYEQIPVSTGGLETLIAKHVKPALAMRRTSFANLERTNLLFDLIVARNHNVFDDLSQVAKTLRDDAEPHAGGTVPLRAVADPRPRRGSYSSLRDVTLLDTLAKQHKVGGA